jgi:hypothetical protein
MIRKKQDSILTAPPAHVAVSPPGPVLAPQLPGQHTEEVPGALKQALGLSEGHP